ncbi:MAG: hypothetical protein AB7S38_27925 [Vulcanimicrobiota bacterium]
MNINTSSVSPLSHRACGCHKPAPRPSQDSAPSDQVQLSNQQPPQQPPSQTPPQDPPPQDPPPQQPPAPSPNIKVNVYAQDPFVSGPILLDFERSKIGENLSGPRVHVTDPGRTVIRADENGNYLAAPNTDGIAQLNSFTATYKTLDLFERYRGSKIDWAFGSESIDVTPHKQEGRNAYYSRWEGGTNFFYFDSPGLNAHVRTANSADIVSHETGHALLDGLRPGFFGTWDPETGGFHEAFGDCAAMLYCLDEANSNDKLMQQTGGSLRHHNVLSSLAEEFGAASKRDNSNPDDDHKTWLRTALNSFTYVDPSELPPGRGDEDHLGREVHSFSRLFSGAFYDVLENIYMKAIYDDRQCPQEALKTASDVAGPALVKAIESGSSSRARYKEIALGMIRADQENGGHYAEAIKSAFLKREIVTPADFEQEEARLAALPKLELNQPLNPEQAAEFVASKAKELGLPEGANLETLDVHTNKAGEQFLSLRYTEEAPVVGVEGYEGFTIDAQNGVTLVFGADGKLKNFVHDRADLDAEMRGIADMKGSNAIADSNQSIFASHDGSIFKAVARGNKLVRVPISSC